MIRLRPILGGVTSFSSSTVVCSDAQSTVLRRPAVWARLLHVAT